MKTSITTIITRKDRSDLKVTVTREPATLNEARAKRPRWFIEVGDDKILSASIVGVHIDYVDFPSSQSPQFSYYLEIVTATGCGIVSLGYTPTTSCADNGADLCAFIPAGKGAAKVWGIYVCRKYRQWRGSCMAYLIAHRRGVKTTCGAEIYALLAGRKLGQAA
jgi:hypothetical protein